MADERPVLSERRGPVVGQTLLIWLALTAAAKPVQKPVVYELEGTKFEGVLVYDDADISITGGPAYVFRPSNPANNYEALDPASLL